MRWIGTMTTAIAMLATAASAQPTGKLPIAKGIWIAAEDMCSTATGVQVYDGVGYGSFGFDGVGPTGGLETILRTAPGKNGYTNAWFDNNTSLDGDLSVKPLGSDGYMTRFVSYGSGFTGGRVEVTEYRYKKCGFATLPAKLQQLLRQRAPQIVPGGAAPPSTGAAPTAALPAPVAPLNIRPGHYVRPDLACSAADEGIFYYDGKRYGWIDQTGFNANFMDPVGQLKKRGAVWDTGFGAKIRVDGVDRIFTSDDNVGDENLRWCPANQILEKARAR